MKNEKRILWIDDEIDFLRAHIKLLEQRGYTVDTATNGEDAIALVKSTPYDLVFLDEMMPGLGGLEALAAIKELQPLLPVIMVTKNETESLMEEAIGSKITDYLIKPVNPSQLVLACKKVFDAKKISSEHLSRNYIDEFQSMSVASQRASTLEEWIELSRKIAEWDVELDAHPDIGLRQTLYDQRRECDAEFAKFIERYYLELLDTAHRSIPISPELVQQYVFPEVQEGRSVFFIVIDCLRYDQWLMMEKLLADYFAIEKNFYLSILPTATPYARNAIFSGLFPSDIAKRFPEIWEEGVEDETSSNRYEHELFNKLFERKGVRLKSEPKYIKILESEFGKNVENNILSYLSSQVTAIVINFVDMLAHGRSESPLLKEIVPDESAYRSLTQSWFQHSSLFGMLKTLSSQKNITIVLTTDHGSIRCLRGAKVVADRETSTNLRFKFGRNLKVDSKHALIIKHPLEYRLPQASITTNYIIAKEDYYFVYPTEYHKYLQHYRDSFQHGGISMEEMILPIIRLRPR
ncbi:MAG TPA: bifunctional response regulator/alkaline phosphatase family protein [Bacteroidota bacterium]|nr:bifunctional response regulator/alkaline phosphatase family protein [Bacteroidota bacterium]